MAHDVGDAPAAQIHIGEDDPHHASAVGDDFERRVRQVSPHLLRDGHPRVRGERADAPVTQNVLQRARRSVGHVHRHRE